MSSRLTILGCGSSGGVPRIGGNWGACDPKNPRNRRRRCSVLFDKFAGDGRTSVLVDTPPDIREQLLDADIRALDAVIFTHDHADHTHGIDDLRVFAYNGRQRVDVYFDAVTGNSLLERFSYCFRTAEGSGYPPILEARMIEPLRPVCVSGLGGDLKLLPFEQQHGPISSLGLRVGDVAYSSDISGLCGASVAALKGLDVWIVDALRYIPHPSHFTVDQALEAIEQVGPKRAILTHLHIDLDYETLKRELPAHVVPAYDGMMIDFD